MPLRPPPPPNPPPHLLPRSPLFFLLIFPPPVSLITPPLIPEEMADGGFTALEAWIVFPFSRSRARQLCPQCPSLSVTVIRLLRYESQRQIRANSPGNKVGCGQNGRGGAFHCCIFMTTVPAENRDGVSFMSEINGSIWNSSDTLHPQRASGGPQWNHGVVHTLLSQHTGNKYSDFNCGD